MRANLSTKLFYFFCCFILATMFSTTYAQTNLKTVWVINTGTYDYVTLDKLTDAQVITDASSFSSGDYNNGIEDITELGGARAFKFGGATFTMPENIQAVEVTIYGWPRQAGATYVRGITLNGEPIVAFENPFDEESENPSPYIFEDCGEPVNDSNRTKENSTTIKINEISEENPVESFNIDISRETHAICKITLRGEFSSSIQNIYIPSYEVDVYYDITGRKVKNPTKGLYIINGKKVFIK